LAMPSECDMGLTNGFPTVPLSWPFEIVAMLPQTVLWTSHRATRALNIVGGRLPGAGRASAAATGEARPASAAARTTEWRSMVAAEISRRCQLLPALPS
jgi:hypothetical protein